MDSPNGQERSIETHREMAASLVSTLALDLFGDRVVLDSVFAKHLYSWLGVGNSPTVPVNI